MTKNDLQKRVNARKQELVIEQDKLTDFREKVTAFINDIKGRSAIYTLVKNLSIWKQLEKLVGGD